MLIVVSLILLITNLVIFARFYWFDLSLGLILVISIMEILVIAINFAYWVPKYKLKW